MRKTILFGLMMGALVLGLHAQVPAKAPLVLEIGAGGNYSFQSDFPGADLSYSGLLTVSYRIGPDSQLGITLLRYNGYWKSEGPLSTYSYGFNYKHFLPESWGGGGDLQPYFSYSILLNQAYVWGIKGHAIAHDSRIGLGLDVKINGPQRFFTELVGDIVEYPTFGADKGLKLNSGGIYLGYKYYF